jgi:hypothetical protein
MDARTRKGLESLAASLTTRRDFHEAEDVLRRRWAQLVREEVARFHLGQHVLWWHRGAMHTGTVRRRNTRTLAVTEDGTNVVWRISPSALTAGSDVTITF